MALTQAGVAPTTPLSLQGDEGVDHGVGSGPQLYVCTRIIPVFPLPLIGSQDPRIRIFLSQDFFIKYT